MDKQAHFRKLEHMYLIAPCNEYYNLIIKVSEGKAEIYIPISEKFYQAGRTIHGSVCNKAKDAMKCGGIYNFEKYSISYIF